MPEPYRTRRAHKVALRKVGRERIATMHIEAAACPHALARVLGLITQHDRVPFSICAQQQPLNQHIRIEIEALSDRAAATLLEKIAAVLSVRRAAWLERANGQTNVVV